MNITIWPTELVMNMVDFNIFETGLMIFFAF